MALTSVGFPSIKGAILHHVMTALDLDGASPRVGDLEVHVDLLPDAHVVKEIAFQVDGEQCVIDTDFGFQTGFSALTFLWVP